MRQGGHASDSKPFLNAFPLPNLKFHKGSRSSCYFVKIISDALQKFIGFFLTMFHWKPQGIFPTLQQSSLAGLPANDAPRLLSECDLTCWKIKVEVLVQWSLDDSPSGWSQKNSSNSRIILGQLPTCHAWHICSSFTKVQQISQSNCGPYKDITSPLAKKHQKNLELKTRFPTLINAWHFRCFLSPKITSWEFTNISRLKWPKSSTNRQLQRLQTWIW